MRVDFGRCVRACDMIRCCASARCVKWGHQHQASTPSINSGHQVVCLVLGTSTRVINSGHQLGSSTRVVNSGRQLGSSTWVWVINSGHQLGSSVRPLARVVGSGRQLGSSRALPHSHYPIFVVCPFLDIAIMLLEHSAKGGWPKK